MNEKRHSLAPYLQNFFSLHLRANHNASQNTIDSYRYTFRLLFDFVESTLNITPDKLYLQHLEESVIINFLIYLELERNNSINTRNNRLSAIRSFFRYVLNREPDLIDLCKKIIDLPTKKAPRKLIYFLKEEEIQSLFRGIKKRTWYEKRDYLILALMIETGVRVEELTGLKVYRVKFDHDPSIDIYGKGRKERSLPLQIPLARQLESWVATNRISLDEFLFTRRHKKNYNLELSRDNIARVLRKYAAQVSSIDLRKLTPHTMRHSFAMRMLRAGTKLPIIQMWLGHEGLETTMIYIHADTEMKREAIELLSQIEHNTQPHDEGNETDNLRKFLEDF